MTQDKDHRRPAAQIGGWSGRGEREAKGERERRRSWHIYAGRYNGS